MKYIKLFELVEVDTSTPCAIYNAEKQELIGLFKSRRLAAQYVFGDKEKMPLISKSISAKGGIRPSSNLLNIRLAARNLNTNQKELLGDKPYLIFNNYPAPNSAFGYNNIWTDADSFYSKKRIEDNKAGKSLQATRAKKKEEKEKFKSMDDLLDNSSPAPLNKNHPN